MCIEIGQVYLNTNSREWLEPVLTVKDFDYSDPDYIIFEEKIGSYHKDMLKDYYTLQSKE